MTIQKDGIMCKCGRKGCFEKYGSILAYKNKIKQELKLEENISGPEMRKAIDENIDKIKHINDEYITNLSIGISNLINIFEPDCVIIGGGFARYEYLLLNDLKNKIVDSKLLFNTRNDVKIEVASLGNDAGIIGASCL